LKGIGDTALFLPATFSVSTSIIYLTSSPFINFSPFLSTISNHSFSSSVLNNYISIGLLVTIPFPLGKNYFPTILSTNVLLPTL